jgi:hypothetical protein
VSDYLRFTPDEYQSLLAVCRSLSPRAPIAIFQRSLVHALRPTHPTLAQRVADWREGQVCILLIHLKGQRDSSESTCGSPAEKSQPGRALTFQEWRSVVQACSVIWLHDDSLTSFKGSLVSEMAAVEPTLADKLAQLSDEDAFALYRRVKSGRRWCP